MMDDPIKRVSRKTNISRVDWPLTLATSHQSRKTNDLKEKIKKKGENEFNLIKGNDRG